MLASPAALIPRGDSESLIELALAERTSVRTILDLGTGTGALLLAALSEYRGAVGLGVDISADAIELACRNARLNDLADRASFLIGGWTSVERGPFDLILSNPPYIALGDSLGPGVADHEPHTALFAGNDGLDAYRAMLPRVSRLLAPGGLAVIEIGSGQQADVSVIANRAGLAAGPVRRDLGGHVRALGFRRADAPS
jgi:release factor glutamine methyltransferase